MSTLIAGAAIVLFIVEELWILLFVVAVVVGLVVLVWQILEGNWPF